MSNFTPEKPVNVLYCEGNTDGTIGGSFFSLLYLVSGIDKDKYNPIVVFHNEHELLDQYSEAGIKTLVIPRPVPVNFKLSTNGILALFNPVLKLLQKSINFIKFFPLTGIQYARLMKKHNIKLLHLNNSIIRNNDWMLGAQIAGIKCITHERGINKFYSRMARYYARKLCAIICISDAVSQNLRDYNIDNGNLITIYNGIDPDIVKVSQTEQEIRKIHSIGSEFTLIGVIGNIKEWKGQETAIRAMAKVIINFPDTICLLVGDTSQGDQYYNDRLTQLIEKLGIENNIIFTGYTKNVANYINIFNVVLHTSILPEPFGRVLIEAMSMKKPVIGARAGAVPEIIDERVTGFTFMPGDDVALAESINLLLENPATASTMGENGYKRLMDNFHISVNINKTQELYETILS